MDNRPTSSFGLPTQRAAAPTVEASQRESRLARDIQEGPAVQLAGYSQNFGQVAFPHDPEDTQRELKGQLMYDPAVRRKYLGVDRAEPGQGVDEPSVQVTVPLTDGDVSYYAKKRAEDEHLAFMQYAASKFNLTDPAQAEIFRRINPEYFTAQMAYIDSRLDTMKRWLSIRTVGIQSMEDITFLWMLDTGRLSLPVGYATFDELSKAGEWHEAVQGGAAAGIYEKGAAQQHGRLGYNNKGIFNPMRLFAADSTAYPINKFGWSSTGDIARVPDHRSGGTYGVYSSGQRVGATPTAEGNARRAGQAFIQPAL